MRWSVADRLPDVQRTVDRYHILDRTVNRNKVKIWNSGSPCTYWRNTALDAIGKRPEHELKCYCWSEPVTGVDSQIGTPDKQHFLCAGTGVIGGGAISGIGKNLPAVGGYQKYGYVELVLSTPTPLTKSSNNLVIIGERGSSYALSGTALNETLTSERFSLHNFKEVDHILMTESIDADQNRIEYKYSIDDSTWTDLVVTNYSNSQLGNRQASLSLPEGTEYIRFRIILKKRYATSQSPKWNSLRFRYRHLLILNQIDPRFSTAIPSFLAARQPQSKMITQGEYGWTTKFPLEWWTLPDADIMNTDIIMFLQGTYTGYRYQVSNLKEYTYGQNLQLLHKDFHSELIRDENELLGIVHYLI